jgi:uncharacterized protein YxjI
MEFPLQLSFKIMALAPQIYVRDSAGQVRMYVKQKLMKLKESVTVFADESQARPLFHINADRVIDFNARYLFTTAEGREVGSVRRRGRRSLWRAHYEILEGESVVLEIRETNPWAKVGDALLGEIPVLGLFAGYLFHPSYQVSPPGGEPVMKVTKRRAFMEGKFDIEKLRDVPPEHEGLSVLSVLMMLLLERRRG